MSACLRSILRTYRVYKDLADRAIAQVSSDQSLHHQIDPDSNSIAIIVKHVAGNLRSRFTDFLTTDGEKPDRHRDAEFEMHHAASREELLRWWQESWAILFSAIEPLGATDLERTIRIRGEELLVIDALNRSVTHVAYHVGQIVYLARHEAGAGWKSLSIPKGRSAEAGTAAFKSGKPV